MRGFSLRRFHLDPEVLAPVSLSWPHPQRLPTSSAGLVSSGPFPSKAGYRHGLRHSRILLSGFQTFRAFAVWLSRIAAFNCRREIRYGHCPIRPHRRWPSTRGKKFLASPKFRLNQLHAGTQFRRLVRSLSIRPSWLLAPCADPTKVALSPLGRLGLLRPGFQFLGLPKNCQI